MARVFEMFLGDGLPTERNLLNTLPLNFDTSIIAIGQVGVEEIQYKVLFYSIYYQFRRYALALTTNVSTRLYSVYPLHNALILT